MIHIPKEIITLTSDLKTDIDSEIEEMIKLLREEKGKKPTKVTITIEFE